MKFVNEWNHRPGNHNVVSMSWFVNDPGGAKDGSGPWDGYGIEYWKTHGNAVGTSGDLYTAFYDTARDGLKAGLPGRRAMTPGVQIFDDFEGSDGRGSGGRFDKSVTFSPQTKGLTNSFTVVTADDSFTHSYSQKLGLFDDTADTKGWTLRHSSGSGSPVSNVAINLTSGDDGYVGFWLRVLTSSGDTPSLTASLILDSGAGGGTLTDAGVARSVNVDGQWHFYEWNLDNAADWTQWKDRDGVVITGDGMIASARHGHDRLNLVDRRERDECRIFPRRRDVQSERQHRRTGPGASDTLARRSRDGVVDASTNQEVILSIPNNESPRIVIRGLLVFRDVATDRCALRRSCLRHRRLCSPRRTTIRRLRRFHRPPRRFASIHAAARLRKNPPAA